MHAELIFLFIVGAFFFVAGIIGICKNKPDTSNLPLLLFPVIGAGIMIVTAGGIWDIPVLSCIKENMETVIPLLFLAIFFVIGVVLILVCTIGKALKKAACTYEIWAQCIELRRRFMSDATSLGSSSTSSIISTYSPVWQYSYNDREYTYKTDYCSSAHPPEQNQYYRVFINPANPEQMYSPEFNHFGALLFIGILFTLFACIGFGIIFFIFL